LDLEETMMARPTDLRPLDPTLDAERWERRIAAITALAGPELARRAALAATPAQVLVGWFRPALAAAAVLSLCAGAALALLGGGSEGPLGGTAEALRLPGPVALWLGDEQPPSVPELALAVRGGQTP
jgi:hypothetical protein